MEKVLVTGITGQTGSYLADISLEKNYEVHGLIRRSSNLNLSRISHILDKITLHYGDLADTSSLMTVLDEVKPDYLFSLAAQSHVQISFQMPDYTADITGVGVLRLLECIRKLHLNTRFLQASSSEMFGNEPPPQNEKTTLHPESPYAAAKIYGYNITKNYRKSYNIFACNSICFNHTSPRRSENFVTKKITKAATRIKKGLQKEIRLGNIDTYRDWGYAKDYGKAMFKIIQHDNPDDFVIATGETHSIREFLEKSFDILGLDPYKYLVIDPQFFRPSEVNYLLGDYTKAKIILGWEPETSFDELVKMMVENDLIESENELKLLNKGA